MNYEQGSTPKSMISALALSAAFFALLAAATALALDPAIQEKLQAIETAQAANRQQLAQYTWQETESISIQGQAKDSKIYQVRFGPDGQQQKTEILEDTEESQGRHEGHFEKELAKKKTAEYEEYSQQISALAKQYTTPNSDLLMKARQQGNISLQPGQGIITLIITSYLKPGDSITMMFDPQTHSPVSVQIKSYLSDSKDAVKVSAEFGQLPAGPNYVVNATIEGVSKQLTINEQNTNYKKL